MSATEALCTLDIRSLSERFTATLGVADDLPRFLLTSGQVCHRSKADALPFAAEYMGLVCERMWGDMKQQADYEQFPINSVNDYNAQFSYISDSVA